MADELTAREREVLTHLSNGKTNKEIADVFGLSEKTVKAHVTGIFKSLGVTNRTEAAVMARQNGSLTQPTQHCPTCRCSKSSPNS